jgi:hypothetical protein
VKSKTVWGWVQLEENLVRGVSLKLEWI